MSRPMAWSVAVNLKDPKGDVSGPHGVALESESKLSGIRMSVVGFRVRKRQESERCGESVNDLTSDAAHDKP